MVDSNEYWSVKKAIQTISKIEEKFDIFWAEEPVRRWDYKGLKMVSDNIKAAVSSGENLNNVEVIIYSKDIENIPYLSKNMIPNVPYTGSRSLNFLYTLVLSCS